jgi:hypothetical protein
MKTIEIKLYSYSELSEQEKKHAYEQWYQNLEFSYIYDDAHQTVKAFNDVFGTEEGRDSWFDVRTGSIDDNILELTGLRLRKYLVNNFGDSLFTRKYLKHGELIDEMKPYHRMKKQKEITNKCPNQGKILVSYYSNIQKNDCCVLTGVCYDDIMLAPIHDFLKQTKFDSTNFGDLLQECFDAIKNCIEGEIEYKSSEEYFEQECIDNNWHFEQDGTIHYN